MTTTKTDKRQRQFRQGDVWLELVDDVDTSKLKRIPREHGAVILAHGEVTGHTHRIEGRTAHLYALEDNRVTGETALQAIARIGGGLIADRVLKVTKAVELRHEEHTTIKLPPGTYRVGIQREYSPAALRSVAD